MNSFFDTKPKKLLIFIKGSFKKHSQNIIATYGWSVPVTLLLLIAAFRPDYQGLAKAVDFLGIIWHTLAFSFLIRLPPIQFSDQNS